MDHPVLTAIRRASFTPLGWFAPAPDDRVPDSARFVILIGNAGPDMFRRFARERDPDRDTLDDWTRDVVSRLAVDVGARAVYPFDTPPQPFLTWARRGGAGPCLAAGPQHPSDLRALARLPRCPALPGRLRPAAAIAGTPPLRVLCRPPLPDRLPRHGLRRHGL